MIRTMTAGVLVALILAPALAHGANPDEIRERSRPTVQEPARSEPPSAALSAAFQKYATMRMLTWRASVSGSILFMGQFNSAEHCDRARRTLAKQLVRYGWGRAECLEIMMP